MPDNSKKPIIPVLLIAAGILLLVAAYAFTFLQGRPEDQNYSGDAVVDNSFDEIPRVTLSQAKSAYDASSAIFVDVRDPMYFESNHIPGAMSIPLGDIASRVGELDPQDWIILYCTWPNEETSARAASILLENGFQRTNPLQGGLQAWSQAGFPIEP